MNICELMTSTFGEKEKKKNCFIFHTFKYYSLIMFWSSILSKKYRRCDEVNGPIIVYRFYLFWVGYDLKFNCEEEQKMGISEFESKNKSEICKENSNLGG